jgi:hypothetical protein
MMERRFRISAILLLCGFGVEVATLFSAHPAAFLVFFGLGGLFLAAGIALYLLTLLQTLVPRRMPQ